MVSALDENFSHTFKREGAKLHINHNLLYVNSDDGHAVDFSLRKRLANPDEGH